MKSSENLRLIVEIRKIYRRACKFLVANAEVYSRYHRIEETTVAPSTKKDFRIQKIMNGSFASVEGWNSFSQWASVALVAFTFVFGLIALLTGNIINARQSAKIAELDKAASDAKAAQQTVEVELNKTKIQLAQTERKIGPRYLTIAEKQRLIDALKPVPKIGRVCVTQHDTLDGEARDFARDITEVLDRAGFTLDLQAKYHRLIVTDENSVPDFINGMLFGRKVVGQQVATRAPGIEFQRRSVVTLKNPAPAWLSCLWQGLHDLGYELRYGGVNSNCPDDMIVIEVCEKPKYPE